MFFNILNKSIINYRFIYTLKDLKCLAKHKVTIATATDFTQQKIFKICSYIMCKL